MVSLHVAIFKKKYKILITNPLATPVLDDPPPPATKQCRLVIISTEYNGKLTRAKRPSLGDRLVGAIFLQSIIY